jgi:Zn-dependent protease
MRLDRFTVIYFGALFLAIILHEIAHGVVALWFGDDTARRAGRLTLNPVPHIDPFGSIILPAMGALAGVPVIGWAKPVPVNPGRLRNPRRDMLVVSLAGPGTNFLLMLASAVVARALYHPTPIGFVSLADLPTGVRSR